MPEMVITAYKVPQFRDFKLSEDPFVDIYRLTAPTYATPEYVECHVRLVEHVERVIDREGAPKLRYGKGLYSLQQAMSFGLAEEILTGEHTGKG